MIPDSQKITRVTSMPGLSTTTSTALGEMRAGEGGNMGVTWGWEQRVLPSKPLFTPTQSAAQMGMCQEYGKLPLPACRVKVGV